MTWFTVFILIGILLVAWLFDWGTDPKARASTLERIKDVQTTASEDVAAKMLQINYTGLVNLALTLPPQRSDEATTKFVALATDLSHQFSNWTEKGFLQMSKDLSERARECQDLDRSSAIANGLAAVWLECHVRKHSVAKLIKTDLDNLLVANTTTPTIRSRPGLSDEELAKAQARWAEIRGRQKPSDEGTA